MYSCKSQHTLPVLFNWLEQATAIKSQSHLLNLLGAKCEYGRHDGRWREGRNNRPLCPMEEIATSGEGAIGLAPANVYVVQIH